MLSRQIVLPSLLALILALLPFAVFAATDTVTDPGDTGVAGQLRQVIANAAAGDTIKFDTTVFGTPQTITLTDGVILINKNLTIIGPGLTFLTVSGNNASEIFDIRGATVDISQMVITDGFSAPSADGGAVINEPNSNLTLDTVTISHSSSLTESGGGVDNIGGTATITNSTIEFNTAEFGGGIACGNGSLTLSGDNILNNTANATGNANVFGGGVFSSGSTVAINNCTFVDNSADTLNNQVLANRDGGGIYSAGDRLTISDSTINGYNGEGLGFFPPLNAAEGAGLYLTPSAGPENATITGSDILDNGEFGSQIDDLPPYTSGAQGIGAGIYNAEGSNLTIQNSTIAYNDTDEPQYISRTTTVYSGIGGGIYNAGNLNISDSTVYGNTSVQGGAIYNDSSGFVTAESSILQNNWSSQFVFVDIPTVIGQIFGFQGSFYVATTEQDVTNNAGSVMSLGSNMLGDPDGNGFVNDPSFTSVMSTGKHDQTSVDGRVFNSLISSIPDYYEPYFTNNGGPTITLDLGSTSSALDTDFADTTPIDQRNAPRPFGVRNDIGAVEHGATAPTPPTITPVTFIVTNTNDSGVGSLRAAVNNASTVASAIITFDPTVFSTPQTIKLTSGAIEVSEPQVQAETIVIKGPGSGLLTVDANHADRVFLITGGTFASQTYATDAVTMSGMAITNGVCPATGPNTQAGFGGGIYASEIGLSLTDVTIENSTAQNGGGLGGIIANVTVSQCRILDNTATVDGGGIYTDDFGEFGTTVHIDSTTVADNTAASEGGGADFSGASALLDGQVLSSTFSGNQAATGGGFAGSPELVQNCTISGNTASVSGGGMNQGPILLEEDTVSGNTAPTGGGVYIPSIPLSQGVGPGMGEIYGDDIIAGNTGGNFTLGPSVTHGTSFGDNIIGDPDSSTFVNDPNHLSPSDLGLRDQTGVTNPKLGPLANYGGPTQTMRLLAGSPAINAALPVNPNALVRARPADTSTDTDQRGIARPQGPYPCIGAYEYGGILADNDSYTTSQGVAVTTTASNGILVNDVADVGGAPITANLIAQPAHGTLVFNQDGTFTYTPALSFAGIDTFTYDVTTGTITSNTATVSIVVSAPVLTAAGTITASNDQYSTPASTTLTVNAPGVMANDGIKVSGTVTSALLTMPTHGTVTLNPDGSFVYTPTVGYNGMDSFTYQDSGSGAVSNAATVLITVGTVALPQTSFGLIQAVNDQYSTTENTPFAQGAPGVLANDINMITGSTITPIVDTPPSNGSVSLNADGSFTYTPNNGFVGTDSFTYFDQPDGDQISAPATVYIVVGASNASGSITAVNDTYSTMENSALPEIASAGVQANDTSTVTGVALSSFLITQPSHGSVTLNQDGSFTYTPSTGFHGQDTFTYDDTAGSISSNTATVTVNVAGAATVQSITAANDSYSTSENTTLTESAPGVLANDVSTVTGSSLTTSDMTQPAHGNLAFNANGSFTYTPATGFTGTDTFTYQDTAGGITSNSATVTITVSTVQTGGSIHLFAPGLTLFSSPVDLSGNALAADFDQPVNLAVWVPSSESYALSPTPPADSIVRGLGYWARFATATNLLGPNANPSAAAASFSIPIVPGWNMIGDPFDSTIQTSTLQLQTNTGTYSISGPITQTLILSEFFYYSSSLNGYVSEQLPTGSMTAFTGYWLYSRCTANLVVTQGGA